MIKKNELLRIENLTVEIGEKIVLKNISMVINEGETHILFGPNGSGKSSLLYTIMGIEGYRILNGKIFFRSEDITNLSIDERARKGIGIAYQHPPAIKGVRLEKLINFIDKESKDIVSLSKELKMKDYLLREVNLGFSGGEMKRSEILQLLSQNPVLSLIDEPESGVDIENIEILGQAIKKLLERHLNRTRTRSGLIITHTGFILDYVKADHAYILLEGKIICEGNPFEIFENIQKNGFTACKNCTK